METKLQRKRPKHLNLFKIKQPLPAQVSILHRISGVLLFFPGTPLLVYILQMLLGSPEGFTKIQLILDDPFVKCALLLPIWFFMHHFCAGIRYLALDLHYGISLEQARLSSKIVLIMGFVLTALVGALLW
jgi:succinate dehydrogenase / fumarate reductase cytochrome b subunit